MIKTDSPIYLLYSTYIVHTDVVKIFGKKCVNKAKSTQSTINLSCVIHSHVLHIEK